MKMETGKAIALIVEAMLPEYTRDKVLHICVEAYYLCFPHADQDGNNISDEIKGHTFVHYIFYRPLNYTRVLRRETLSSSLDDENGKIFYQTSYHDSCWRQDGVESDLDRIHWRIVEKMEKKYKRITGRNMPLKRILDQPNFCTFKIELFQGEVSALGHDSREYRLNIKNGNTNFIQVKEIRLDEYGRLVFKHKTNPNLFVERPYDWVDRITVLDETEGRRVIRGAKYSTFDFTDWEPMTLDEYRSVRRKYKDFRKGKK